MGCLTNKVISEESSGEDEGEEYSQAEGTARAKARAHTACPAFPRNCEGTHQGKWKEQAEEMGTGTGMRAAREVA